MERKNRDLVVCNSTFERWEFPIFSRVFTFEPRSETLIDERYIWPIEKEHKEKGLYVFEEGDDKAAKQKSALLFYADRELQGRINNYKTMLDEYKKKGVILEEPVAMKLAKKWQSEIYKFYNREAQVMQVENSFLDLPKIKAPKIEKIEKEIPVGELN